jgi:CarD family transcriptional regulator
MAARFKAIHHGHNAVDQHEVGESFREKRMLDRAKFLIVSEISEVMRETAESIEGRVEKALERSFATRTRAIARAKAAKATPAARPVAARRAVRAS